MVTHFELPELTLNRLKKLTSIVVERQGCTFVYNDGSGACFYVPQPVSDKFPETDPRTKSGCLIGEILKEHGVKHADLQGLSTYSARDAIQRLIRRKIVKVSFTVEDIMAAMQHRQDRGKSWGEIHDYLMTIPG